jgi:hypothetical protein
MATLAAAKKFDAFTTNPSNLTILGLDVEVPKDFVHPAYQPLRLAQIKRTKEETDKLVAAIKAVKEVVVPLNVCKDKINGAEYQVVGAGQRRTIATRIVNEDQEWLDANNGGNPILVRVVLMDKHDPLLRDKIRAENSGRLDADPTDIAAEISQELAAWSPEAPNYAERYAIAAGKYGRNEQFARTMQKLHEDAVPEVKAALKKGPARGGIGVVTAMELATLEPEEQLRVLNEAIANGDTSTRAIKGAKSAAKGNRTRGTDGATRRTDREVKRAVEGLFLDIAAAKTNAERERLQIELNALRWTLAEQHEFDNGGTVHSDLMTALSSAESVDKDGTKARDTEPEPAKEPKKKKKKKAAKKAA